VLHYIDGGLWGRHLWVELLEILEDAEVLDVFEERYAQQQ
jgi:hypothetical protein